jgi:hypothetical protein
MIGEYNTIQNSNPCLCALLSPKTVLPPTDAGISYSYSTVPANRLYAQDGSGLHAATTAPSLRRCWEMRASQHALHGTSSDSAGSLLTPASQLSGQCFCGASKAIRVTPESRTNRTLLPVAPTGVAMPPWSAGFGKVARLDCTGGRISPYRWQDNSASGMSWLGECAQTDSGPRVAPLWNAP